MTAAPFRIGVDIGGTFTDFVLLDTRDGALRNGKVLTTPAAPEQAVLSGIRQLLDAHGIAPGDVQHVIHGTTLVANALIERRGVPTGLVTTDGFRDVVEIGTELRHDTYDLFMRVPEPLVPRRRRAKSRNASCPMAASARRSTRPPPAPRFATLPRKASRRSPSVSCMPSATPCMNAAWRRSSPRKHPA